MLSLLSILLGTRGGGPCLKAHLFSELGAEALTRPPTGPGWVRSPKLQGIPPQALPGLLPDPAPGLRPSQGALPDQQLPPPLPGPSGVRMCSVATACGSHPKAQSEMKDKWLLHLSQIAFFGLSLAIWHGFLGWGGLRGTCMLPAQSCAGWRRWAVGGRGQYGLLSGLQAPSLQLNRPWHKPARTG